VKKFYAPLLFKNSSRLVVLVTFFGSFCFNASLLHKIDVGLDQQLSMPEDSYVLEYFKYGFFSFWAIFDFLILKCF
jgi:Niemann-Pick C1 protein